MLWIKALHTKFYPGLLGNPNFSMEKPPCDQCLHDLNTAHYQGSRRRICLDDFCAERIQGMVKQRFTSAFEVSGNMVLLYFLLEGNLQIEHESQAPLEISMGAHNISHCPSTTGKIHCPCGKLDLFYIGISTADFYRYLPYSPDFLKDFKEKVEQHQAVFLGKHDGVISPKMYAIINEICTQGKDEELPEVLIRAKILELISCQFQQFKNPTTPSSAQKKVFQKMYAVRDFILKHTGDYYSLTDLAKQVGTNEFTLKKEFKALFGKTVFGFWGEVKMETAQRLLLENEKSIKEISELVGYKHPQHFSTAFKEAFKCTPSDFRKTHCSRMLNNKF